MKIIQIERGMSGAGRITTSLDFYYFEFSTPDVLKLEGYDVEIKQLIDRKWVSELRLAGKVIGRITGDRIIWSPAKVLRKALA